MYDDESELPCIYAVSYTHLLYAIAYFFYFSASVNVTLAVFNLIPIPPLDGSGASKNAQGKGLSLIHILHAGRFRESEINFVFCEWELYDGTAPEQKTKSAKNGLDLSLIHI